MPRVNFVKKARKAYPHAGIKAGDQYYWWKFRYGPKHRSLTKPTPQQLTQSEFWIRVYDLQERIQGLEWSEGIEDQVEEIVEELREFADEQEEKLNNMPDSLQEGDVGQMLQERYEGISEWADELEGVEMDSYDRGTNEIIEDLKQYEYYGS